MFETIISQLRPRATAQKSFEKGEHLFNRDDRVLSLFLVTDGGVHLVRYQADGDTAVLQRSGPGMVLAEASVFSERYHCDAVAITSTRALVVPVAEVRRLLDDDPAFARAWTIHLSRELQSARKRAEIVALRTVSARLDAWMTWNDGRLPVKGDWRALAEEIGVSPEALYREMSRRRSRDSRASIRNGNDDR
ncbi:MULTISPECIES: Crp/Fnr family transcriptional regulator [unclassified Sinorhizobium]|uniref:Crp/Fnr family transcriptional regulator n=1 Tax=unclassified Sinorhizobium TaxID=2613772 RepID=UPI0024C2EBC2|nr:MULTISPECIES: Crp/Fnr family transcriptional regulator [unclassified Sinorhizobium]MDK1373396.1 Crp/Fnr family transcriptional regulator [Sinorhizobium sp. 6-70]MDK1482040.1 Crp/Fnr family transcriptional regulator [Sinorhizobium sp. 6-117]